MHFNATHCAFIVLFYRICVIGNAAERRLYFVQAIFRHGDRAPESKPYPDDPYDESYWPRGWKELTNLGMRQMKELGEFYRQRYNGFVGRNFSSAEICVQSSDENRALVSAQAFLNGFYPPNGIRDEFEPHLAWQPLPVHTSGYNVADPLLKPTNFLCPAYDRLNDAVDANLEVELNTKYSRFIDYVAPYINGGKRPTLKQVRKINDINREISHNLTQPSWVYHAFPEYENQTVIELATMMWLRHRVSLFQTPELARLRGGFLLGDWLKRAKRLIKQLNSTAKSESKPKKHNYKANQGIKKKKKDPKRMQLYSSHDGTILALLAAMDLNREGRAVPYASAFIMEIYLEDNGKTLTTELYFRRNGVLESMEIEGCNNPCELGKFIRLFHKKAIFKEKNLYKKCDLSYCSPNDIIEHIS